MLLSLSYQEIGDYQKGNIEHIHGTVMEFNKNFQ